MKVRHVVALAAALLAVVGVVCLAVRQVPPAAPPANPNHMVVPDAAAGKLPAALALTKNFITEVHQRGDEAGKVIAVLPENHIEAERDRILLLLDEVNRTTPVDVLEVENYIASPDDAAWVEAMRPLAAVLKKPAEQLIQPSGSGRYDSLFNGRWKARGLERARPRAFIDSGLLLQTVKQANAMKTAAESGLEYIGDTERFVGNVTYLRERYELPEVPEAMRKRLSFTRADIPYGEELFIAAAKHLIKGPRQQRDLGMAETLVADLQEDTSNLIVVIIGRGHVSRVGMPEALKSTPLLTELLQSRMPKGAWLLSVEKRR